MPHFYDYSGAKPQTKAERKRAALVERYRNAGTKRQRRRGGA